MIRYRLDGEVAVRRAWVSAGVEAATSLAPVIFALVLVSKLGWRAPGALFWVAAGLVVLVLVRAAAGYQVTRRRLGSLVVHAGDEGLRVETSRSAQLIDRAHVARITEVAGPLGGLRVQSAPDPRSGVSSVLHVPRGGDGFGEVRAYLERWRPIERRSRRGVAVRVALGAFVVAGIFFVPFLLDDFVARSRFLAAGLVVGMWIGTRVVLRRG